MVLGDFNDLLRSSEKKGINVHPNWLLKGFRDTVFDCGLSDLPMEGYPFTWERGRGTSRWVQERLDRVFVNEDWRGKFAVHKVQNLVAPTSDHSAIFLQLSTWRPVPCGYHFRFENSWLREDRCSYIVATCWEQNKLKTFTKKIRCSGQEL